MEPKKYTHKIECTEEHLRLITKYVEAMHRAICGDYEMFLKVVSEYNQSDTNREKYEGLSNHLKSVLQPELSHNSSYAGTHEALGYQTYRDILEHFAKDLPTESMNTYRHPMDQIAKEPKLKISNL